MNLKQMPSATGTILLLILGIGAIRSTAYGWDRPQLYPNDWHRLINGSGDDDAAQKGCTETGLQVLQSLKKHWPFISKDITTRNEPVRNDNLLCFSLSKIGCTNVVEVSTQWFGKGDGRDFPWEGWKFDDLLIVSVGGRKVNLWLSQWIKDPATAQRRFIREVCTKFIEMGFER